MDRRQNRETGSITTFEAIIYNRKEIEQMKKTIKIIKYIIGYAAVISTFDLILIAVLIKMQILVF